MAAINLRRMADSYRELANQADADGQFALAASHARVSELFLKEAEKLEAQYPEPGEKPMICEGCGAVGRHDGVRFVWTPPDPNVVTEDRATCPECHRAMVLAKRRGRLYEARRTEWRAANGTLRCELPEDPFRAFKDEPQSR